jgi:phosphate-selective porin OprO/OprP
MKFKHNTYLPLAALLAFASAAPAADLTVQEQIDALKARIAELDAKVRPLQRAETTAGGEKGFALVSADESTSLKLRGLLQADSRWFFDKNIDNDAFVIRRARLGLEGKFAGTTEYQLIGDFASSSATLLDANVTASYSPEVQLKLGRFKTPVGLEQLQGDSSTLFFTERSVVSQLLPNRDIGAQLGGVLLDGRITYAVGIFNGTVDANDGKDFAGRVMFSPWAKDSESVLRGLSFGLGASYGLQDASGALTSGYKSDGQQTIFAYNSNTFANGKVRRLSPQLSYYNGSFGLFAEYAASSADVRRGGAVGNLRHHAWQLEGGYVLTGEKSAYSGVIPGHDFDRAAGTWGAVEIVGRLSSISFDDKAFVNGATTGFADPTKSARSADTIGVGVNWYLNRFYRFSVDFEYTRFGLYPGSAAPSGAVVSHPERALLTRYQFSF